MKIKEKEIPYCMLNTPGRARVYKIKFPNNGGLRDFIFNNNIREGNKYVQDFVNGESYICLWFRKTDRGNQISLEYNYWDSQSKNHKIQESRSGSIGKIFAEAYLPISDINFLIKCLEVFQKIIKKRDHKKFIEVIEFKKIVKEEFSKENKNDKSI